MRRRPNSSLRRGFTLVELLVGVGISAFLVAAAVALTGDHVRLLGMTSDRVDMYQTSRRALDILAYDVRQAGVGIGYRPSGVFDGLTRGSFSTDGGATFVSNGRKISLSTGEITTDDLGIRTVTGKFRTLAAFDNGTAQMCDGGDFENGDIVAFTSREGLFSMTARIDGLNAAACSLGNCVSGCVGFSWTSVPSFASDPSAWTVTYTEGLVARGYEHVVWYVHADNGRADLRRAAITPDRPCSELGCGGTVMEGVETLQVAVWGWDRSSDSWLDVTAEPQIADRERLRVDLEMVVRGDSDFEQRQQPPIQLQLDPECVPSCDQGDYVNRWALRTTIEIRNSGRLQLR